MRLHVVHSVLVAAAVMVAARGAAPAHVQVLRGRLVDSVERSDLIVIGRVLHVAVRGPRTIELTALVDTTLVGNAPAPSLVVRSPSGLVRGERYVLCLQWKEGGWRSVAPSGTLFPTAPDDDAGYRRAIASIRAALDGPAGERVPALQTALIESLSASAPALRYYAALELVGLGHREHTLSASQRTALERALNARGADPDLRSLLSPLLQPAAPGPTPPA